MLVGSEQATARAAADQVRRARLGAAAAVFVVRRQIPAHAATAALPGLATGAIAAICVVWADLAAGATSGWIGVGIDAEAAAVRQILRTGAEATARLVLVADRARAAASISVFAACLTNEATRARCSNAVPRSDAGANRNCGKGAHNCATSGRRPNRPCDFIKLLTIHLFKLPALYH
jgi:hypothetical protein